jgi:hypothetical protein
MARTAKTPAIEKQEQIMEAQTYTDPDTNELHVRHYAPPEKTDSNPLSQFDYSKLRGAQFKKYFELVEGKVMHQKSHSMAERQGGMNRTKKYLFDKYRAYAIKEETSPGFKEIVGIELVKTTPVNVGMRLPLQHAVTLNHYLGEATSSYPMDLYLLNQTQTL